MIRRGFKKSGAGILMALLVMAVSGCGGDGDVSSDMSSDDDSSGTGISSMFSSPAEMGVGDIMPIEFNESTQVSVDFAGVESGVNFILAVGSYGYSGSGTTMQLATASEVLPDLGGMAKGMMAEGVFEEPVIDDEYGPAEILHAWLRASESELAYTEEDVEESYGAMGAKAMGIKAVAVGESETFRVLSSLTSTTSYVEVEGQARCVGDNVVFYVDVDVPEASLSDADIEELCGDFDVMAGEEQDLLGDPSDVDGDGKVHVLMTKQINQLGALGGGIITGYFYAGDLYAQSSSNPVSNEREVIYTMVPDPDGTWGSTISHSFAMSNLLPAVMPHELQHAISYNQHVFVNGGSTEENWLNEGMSHFIEDYLGVGNENPSRYAMFLASPSTYGVVTQGSPNLLERGASYLFLRYLYEQASDGEQFLQSLVQTSKRGVTNLEAAFNGEDMSSFSEMMARWTIALAMTDRGISQDARYVYRSRVANSLTGNWHGVCLECDADDNRGTELDGVNLNTYFGYHTASIDASAMKFYEMKMLPNEMVLSGTSNGGNYGILIRSK